MSVEENKSKKYNSNLLVEKYRPPTVRSILLPEKFKTYFNRIVETKDVPNLLLYSTTPGCGKTSMARAICRDVNALVLDINCSKSGINTLRTDIEKFAVNKSLDKRQKVVIMDEFDGATHQLQLGMKAFIEQYHKNCRFIFTANSINKIIEPLKEGRTQLFDFNMSKKEYIEEMTNKIKSRLLGILKREDIDYDDYVIDRLIEKCYPNIRSMLSSIQKCYNMSGRIDESILTTNSIDANDEKLTNLILSKKIIQTKKFVLENGYSFDEIYTILYKELVPVLEPKYQADAIILIAEFMDRHTRSINPEITFMAMLAEIMMMVK